MTNKSIIAVVAIIILLAAGGIVFYFYSQNQKAGPAGNQAQIILGITDSAASMGGISSIFMDVGGAQLHSTSQGWVNVFGGQMHYDLLALRQSGTVALLSRANVGVGDYDQIKLSVNKVTVVKNGVSQDAKLPAGDMVMSIPITAQANTTSSIVFDFIADESLHQTVGGQFVFAPVVNAQVKSAVSASIDSKGILTINGGTIAATVALGMDENGQMKTNFVLDANVNLNLVGDVLEIKQQGQNDSALKISAAMAVNNAITGGYLNKALSVRLINYNGIKVWQVSGMSGVVLKSVLIDATTGAYVNSQ